MIVNAFIADAVSPHPYRQPQWCSNRLENALEYMRRRSLQMATKQRSRSYVVEPPPETPYAIYQSLYGPQQEPPLEDDFYEGNRRNIKRLRYYSKQMADLQQAINSNLHQLPRHQHATLFNHGGDNDMYATSLEQNSKQGYVSPPYSPLKQSKLDVSRVEVEDLKVRMPAAKDSQWVQVDKCNFSSDNYTLDTRLIFPDLTLSGRVVLHPSGGKCNMILRLRRAGIEFHTIPIGFENIKFEETHRLGAASIRTDSHFAEPGFISVFAHGCQGKY